MRLNIQISDIIFRHELYTAPDPSWPVGGFDISRSRNVKMTTGPHGYESLTGFLPIRFPDSDQFFLNDRADYIYLSAGALEIWKGRLEDVVHTSEGIKWTAYGPYRYFADKLISKTYSTQDISSIVPITTDDQSGYNNSKYVMDRNDRLFIGTRKNEIYAASSAEIGGMIFYAPHLRDDIKRVEFSFDVQLPGIGWQADIVSYAEGFASGNIEWSRSSSGAGTATATLTTARPLITFRFIYSGGSPYNETAETAANYAKWTDIRFKNADNATVVASAIVADVLAEVESLNSKISSNPMLIEATTEDIFEAVWEDIKADAVLRDIAATNDAAASNPTQYEIGMWGDHLHFWPKYTDAIIWFADVDGRNYERTLAALANSFYAKYRSASNNRQLRTADAEDTDSQERYQITREDYIRENTTDSAQAIDNRDMLRENLADPPYKIAMDIQNIRMQEGGGIVPPWFVRSGDKIVIRNGVHLPGPAGLDYFVIGIARTELNIDIMQLKITPEAGSANIPMAIAQRPYSSLLPIVGNQQRYQDPRRRAFR